MEKQQIGMEIMLSAEIRTSSERVSATLSEIATLATWIQIREDRDTVLIALLTSLDLRFQQDMQVRLSLDDTGLFPRKYSPTWLRKPGSLHEWAVWMDSRLSVHLVATMALQSEVVGLVEPCR